MFAFGLVFLLLFVLIFYLWDFSPVFTLDLEEVTDVRNWRYESSVVNLPCNRLLSLTSCYLYTPASLKQTPVTSLGE